jgi:hypothetical protein
MAPLRIIILCTDEDVERKEEKGSGRGGRG